MISIKTIHGFIDLGDTQLNVEENSPFFDKDDFTISYSYPFTIPITSFNSDLINHIQLIQSDDSDVALDISLYEDGVKIADGQLLISSGDFNLNNMTGTVNALLYYEDSIFNDLADKMKVNELKMDGVRSIPGIDWDIDVAHMPPGTGSLDDHATSDYVNNIILSGDDYICFPMFGDHNYFPDSYGPFSYRHWLNYFDKDGLGYAPSHYELSDGSGNTYRFFNYYVPCYFLHQVIKHCFSELGYSLKADFLNDDWVKKICLINNYSISIPHYIKAQISSVVLGEFYQERTTEINPANHLPALTIKEFLREMFARFFVTLKFNGKQVTMIQDNLDHVQGDLSNDVLSTVGFEIKTDVKGLLLNNLSNEKDSLTAYLSEDQTYFFQPFQEANTRVDVQTASFSGTTEYWYVKEDFTFYKRITATHLRRISPPTVQYKTGEKPRKFDFTIIPVAMRSFDFEIDVAHTPITAATAMPGNYQPVRNSNMEYNGYGGDSLYNSDDNPERVVNDSLFFLAFYLGQQYTQSSVTGINIPYATPNNYIPDTGNVGPWHLGWWGSEGLVNTFGNGLVKVYNSERKILLRMKPDLKYMFGHEWNKSWLFRGRKVYVSAKKYDLPIGDSIMYECYRL